MPVWPEPDTDWYEVAVIARRPAAAWSGPTAIISTIVVQLGLAMIPWWSADGVVVHLGDDERHCGSIRKADELSTHRPRPRRTSGRTPWTGPRRPRTGRCRSRQDRRSPDPRRRHRPTWSAPTRPADRDDAIRRSSATGKSRSSRIASIVVPTAPVAPTTATVDWLAHRSAPPGAAHRGRNPSWSDRDGLRRHRRLARHRISGSARSRSSRC